MHLSAYASRSSPRFLHIHQSVSKGCFKHSRLSSDARGFYQSLELWVTLVRRWPSARIRASYSAGKTGKARMSEHGCSFHKERAGAYMRDSLQQCFTGGHDPKIDRILIASRCAQVAVMIPTRRTTPHMV